MAVRSAQSLLASLRLPIRPARIQSLLPAHIRSSPFLNPSPFSSPLAARSAHSIPRPPPRAPQNLQQDEFDDDGPSQPPAGNESARPDPRGPAYYQLSFTCVPCGHRSHHNVSKQGYHHGSTLITCPGCRNRHVISDHLGIFGDRKITVEDLMREKGRLVKRGSLGEDGDIEFWPDEVGDEKFPGGDKI
ncbi:Uncharacterized protein ESCO_004684 [Escovopsis weberi]|uniref:DNL-type domain-containing protein n=1 Tax=Escovopsis weberi TaxID=150374 RepID=A0A0M8MR04_ESCWE|nr:Uncharacterized protein ESCO_004684 [Escovopsis weberi]